MGEGGELAAAAPARQSAGVETIVVFAGLCAAALALVAATPVPAMLDYCNHLARMYILAADRAGEASPFYQVSWALYPNLAADLVTPWLARFVDVDVAQRIFLVVSQGLVVSGAVAVERVVKRRFEASGFVALLFLYSQPFAWGFLNFEFSLGLALWGVAVWLSLRGRPWPLRLAAHSLFVLALFLSHMLGLGLYGFVLGLHELWLARRDHTRLPRLAAEAGLLAAPALLVVAAMALLGGSVGDDGNAWGLAYKPLWPFLVINGYSPLLSIASFGVLALLLLRLGRARALRFESSGAWLATGLLLLYVLFPQRLFGTNFDDLRVIVAAALLLPAFGTVTFPDDRWRRRVGALILGLVLANLGFTAAVWTSYRADYRDMIASFGRIGKGAKILIASTNADNPLQNIDLLPMFHAPILATHYAGALAPTLFTTRGKQPVDMRPPYQKFSSEEGGPVDMSELKAVAELGPTARIGDDYIRNWPRDFDYLYFIGAPRPNPLPRRLEEMEAHDRFTLYRVRKAGAN